MSHPRTGRLRAALLALLLAMLAGFAGLLGGASSAPAQTGAPAQMAREPAIQPVAEAPGEVLDYWTTRRMRRAEPLALEAPERAPLVESSTTAPAERDLLLHSAFSSHEVPDTSAHPNRIHGKVFFAIGSSRYVCSATVVHAPAENVVLTAGHCVFDAGGTDRFVDNFLFVPGYEDGAAPFGSWPAEALATTSNWQRDGNLNYDLGVAVLGQVGGQEVEEAVGSRGIAFNQPREQGYDAYGYPAGAPFTGQKLWECESQYFGDDPYYKPPGPAPLGIGCDLNGGSSGGGWVIAGGYVASVVSFGYPTVASEEDHLYGPYFGAVAKDLYASVDGIATEPPDRVSARAPDTIAPQTTITIGPADGSTITDPTPTFGLSSSEVGSGFECQTDGGAFTPCFSPRQIGPLEDGAHSFAVRATDSSGNTDPTPVRRAFTIDTRVLQPGVSAKGTQVQGLQRIRIKVGVGAGERVLAAAGGRIRVGKRGSYELRSVTRTLEPNDPNVLRLQPARESGEIRILRALARGKRVRAAIGVRMSDAVGNVAAEQRLVKLK